MLRNNQALKDMSAITETAGGSFVGDQTLRDSGSMAAFVDAIDNLSDDAKDGLYVWINDGARLVIIDALDWWGGTAVDEQSLKSAASKFAGDEQNVVWHNEGAAPNIGWEQLWPRKGEAVKQYHIHASVQGRMVRLDSGMPVPYGATGFCIKNAVGEIHDSRVFKSFELATKVLTLLKTSCA